MPIPKSPYLNFTKELLAKHQVGFKIANNDLTFDAPVTDVAKERFFEYFVLKLDMAMAYHPMYGHFILCKKPITGEDPCIMWSEASELYPPEN